MTDRYDLSQLNPAPSLLDGLPRREYDAPPLEPCVWTQEGISVPVSLLPGPPRPLGLRRQVRNAALDGLCGLLWLAVGMLAGYGLAWWRGLP